MFSMYVFYVSQVIYVLYIGFLCFLCFLCFLGYLCFLCYVRTVSFLCFLNMMWGDDHGWVVVAPSKYSSGTKKVGSTKFDCIWLTLVVYHCGGISYWLPQATVTTEIGDDNRTCIPAMKIAYLNHHQAAIINPTCTEWLGGDYILWCVRQIGSPSLHPTRHQRELGVLGHFNFSKIQTKETPRLYREHPNRFSKICVYAPYRKLQKIQPCS